jgi:protein TonB
MEKRGRQTIMNWHTLRLRFYSPMNDKDEFHSLAHRRWADLVAGGVVAFMFIGGVAWLGEVYKAGPAKAIRRPEERTIEIHMPPVEPDPEEVKDQDTDTPPPDLAPPMQTDVPQIVTDSSFVQQLEPPPPENMQMNKGAIIIPRGERTTVTSASKIFDIKDLDQEPEKRFAPNAAYPFDLQAARISGAGMVYFVVDANGDVRDVHAEGFVRREFDEAAVAAVRKWKFRPGRKNGRAVSTRMDIPIEFSMDAGDN